MLIRPVCDQLPRLPRELSPSEGSPSPRVRRSRSNPSALKQFFTRALEYTLRHTPHPARQTLHPGLALAAVLALACLLARADAVAPSSAKAATKKLRVLCLHGFGQNGEVLRDRSGAFRKPLKKSRFELTYVDAPFPCADADATSQRAWWRTSDDGVTTYDGWDTSRAQLVDRWRAEGFDGILGFSQGAAAAAMLCAEVRPRFAVLVAGFVPRDREAAATLLAGVEGVPTLHVYGRTDAIVETERSRALAALFGGASIVEHDGGHMLPAGAGVRREVEAFLAGLGADSPPPPLLGPGDAVWNDLEALQNEWTLSDAIEQRNRAQRDSFVDADAQWAAQDEGDRWLLRRKPFVERRIDELRMQHGAHETDP